MLAIQYIILMSPVRFSLRMSALACFVGSFSQWCAHMYLKSNASNTYLKQNAFASRTKTPADYQQTTVKGGVYILPRVSMQICIENINIL